MPKRNHANTRKMLAIADFDKQMLAEAAKSDNLKLKELINMERDSEFLKEYRTLIIMEIAELLAVEDKVERFFALQKYVLMLEDMIDEAEEKESKD